MKNLEIPESRQFSEKLIELLTLEGDSLRLSSITSQEKKMLYNILVINAIYFDNDKRILKIVDDYLNLSVSINGKLLDKITEIHKEGERRELGLPIPQK